MVQSIRIINIPYFDYKETNDLCQRDTTHDCLSIYLSVCITINFRGTNDHYIVLMKPDFLLKKSRTKHDLNIFFIKASICITLVRRDRFLKGWIYG